MAGEAMKAGAFAYVTKPVELKPVAQVRRLC